MRTPPDRRTVALTAVLGGLLLGIVDFVWIRFLPYPVGNLGNSSAVWAVAAFGFGFWVRTGRVRAATGAAAGLVVAVPGYYLAAALIQDDDWSVLWAPTSLVWMCFGVLAGVVFGVGGIWAHRRGWRQVVGTALPGAVLFAEALLDARRVAHPGYGTEPLWDALLKVTLGVLVVLVVGRAARPRLLALAAAMPLALAGFTAFLLAGFG
ncbi:DUF6518 family protein [Micromonospora radicis]|uniref:Uncharacterized protein n=1 Tax=Micromonospora radicis TaxID=1894971 RepID=A0A418N162_9ACTN|nr:DUF6518 family protein [Micromonospora radicis]RIV41544.1 hypothetical protein D2L64_02345 [Micromonospora radicis]